MCYIFTIYQYLNANIHIIKIRIQKFSSEKANIFIERVKALGRPLYCRAHIWFHLHHHDKSDAFKRKQSTASNCYQ